MDFVKAKVEDEIYMRKSADGTHWEYLCTYIDDLLFAVDDPDLFITQVKEGFTLKGTEPTQHHLGCDFGRDDDGTLFMDPSGYITGMEEPYTTHFKVKPKAPQRNSPLEKNDHPEIDVSEFLGEEDTLLYQSLIGSMQ